MLGKHATQAKLLVPAIAVTIAFAAFFDAPLQRDHRRVSAGSLQQSAAVEELANRLKTQQESLRQQAERNELGALNRQVSTTPNAVLHQRNGQTIVQAFAHVLSIFQSHSVNCTSAKPDKLDGKEQTGVITHRVSLTGGFKSVLTALESIEENLPQALAAEFFMERPDPSEACQWEIAFRFSEEIE